MDALTSGAFRGFVAAECWYSLLGRPALGLHCIGRTSKDCDGWPSQRDLLARDLNMVEFRLPHLEKQVAVVTALMRASSSWNQFMKSFDRNFGPDQARQTELFEDYDEEAAN